MKARTDQFQSEFESVIIVNTGSKDPKSPRVSAYGTSAASRQADHTNSANLRWPFALRVKLFNVSRRLELGAYCVGNRGIPAQNEGILLYCR
eukprot:COSAG02_NODE_2989_length_7609_cov_11.207723_7_plen_92_part_00